MSLSLLSGSLIVQLVKNLPAMQETWVQFLSWKGPLEQGKAAHSSILPGDFNSPLAHKESDMTDFHFHKMMTSLLYIWTFLKNLFISSTNL